MEITHTEVGQDARKSIPTSNDVIYVHLCSGEVIEVSPATGVCLTGDELLVLDGEKVAATFSRPDVYWTSDVPMEPPSFG